MINDGLSRDLCDHAIDQWILGRNGERDRYILRMYLFDGVTFEMMQRRLDTYARSIGDPAYSLSVDQLKKIICKRKEELFRHI